MTATPPPPPSEGRVAGLIKLAQGLTFWNLLILAGLAAIAVPVFVIYKAVTGDEKLLDRLMSTYEEEHDESGCLLRHVQERGGPDMWGISSGFAFQGGDRYYISVILTHAPSSKEETASYCEAVKLIADSIVAGGYGPRQ